MPIQSMNSKIFFDSFKFKNTGQNVNHHLLFEQDLLLHRLTLRQFITNSYKLYY